MIVFDQDGSVIENPDKTFGYIEEKTISVVHQYIMDEPAVTHEEVVKEYPETGGKDVRIVVDVPEKGHWETRDQNGNLINDFEEDLEAFPRDVPIEDVWIYGIYIPYTEEELADRQQKREELEVEIAKREEFMQNGPDQLEEVATTQEDMILWLADIVGGAA